MTKTYSVKSIFGPTIQGEGSLAGAVTLFLRFAGCNMWDGRPETREASRCPFCDTDFFGGTKMTAEEIVTRLRALCDDRPGMWVTISGGEPLLQLDADLAKALAVSCFKIAIETNGTRRMPGELATWVHYVTMSPKVPLEQIKLSGCDDLKVLYPHPNPAITPEAFENFPSRYAYLQSVNDVDTLDDDNVQACLRKLYELQRTRPWRLSVQLHKVIGVE